MKNHSRSRSRNLQFHRAQDKNIFHRKGLRRVQRWLGIPRWEDRSGRNSTAGGCKRDPGGTGCYGQSRRPDRHHRVRLPGIPFIHGLFLVRGRVGRTEASRGGGRQVADCFLQVQIT